MPLPAGQLKERLRYRYGLISEIPGSLPGIRNSLGRVIAFRLFSTPIAEEQIIHEVCVGTLYTAAAEA